MKNWLFWIFWFALGLAVIYGLANFATVGPQVKNALGF